MNNNLFDEFDSVSAKQWKQKVQVDLKGNDYNETLTWKSDEGIIIKPLYTHEDLVNQKKKPLTNLEFSKNKPDNNSYNYTNDVITSYAKNGKWITSQNKDFLFTKNEITNHEKHLLIDTSLYQNAGANVLQQIAYALAITDEYVNVLGEEILQRIHFKVAISSNFFFEISKLKAIRNTWNWFLAEKNTSFPTKLIAKSSLRNKQNKKTNQQKVATEYLSAIIGGADKFEQIEIKDNQDLIEGTFYSTHLTEQFSENSIQIFKLIKENGGFIKQLKQGTIQKKIKEAAKKNIYSPEIFKNIRKTEIEPIIQIKSPSLKNNNNLAKLLDFFSKNNHPSLTHTTINFTAGFPPFLRGATTTMYIQRKWDNNFNKENSTNKIIVEENIFKTPQICLSELFTKAIEFLKIEISKNRSIDDITPNIIFVLNIEDSFFEGIAKLRASRAIWSKIIKHYTPKKNSSMIMQQHCIIKSKTLQQESIQTLAAILGGCISVQTSADTNSFLQNETFINKTIDPLGGNNILEDLTINLIDSVWNTIQNNIKLP